MEQKVERVSLKELSLMPPAIVPIDVSDRAIGVTLALLTEHGQPVPALAQKSTGRIFFGGEFYLAFQKMGVEEMQVIYRDCDDDEAAKIAVRMRRQVELSGWHDEELTQLLAKWEDPEAFGFSDEEFGEMLAELERADVTTNDAADPGPAVPENLKALQEKWKTERGQLWLIASKSVPGKCHRLLIGDSANEADVIRAMGGQKAALFATDPPYLVDYTGNDRPGDTAGKDWSAVYQEASLTKEQGEDLYRNYMRLAIEHAINPSAAWYQWHADKKRGFVEGLWDENGVLAHQTIIWNKTRAIPTHSIYMWKHEPCLMGWLKGNKSERLIEMGGLHTVWEADNPQGSSDNLHPTSKPTVLFETPMRVHTHPGEICYEPFSGSGSQHVAGEKLGRLVFGIEISPYFAAGILERLSGMGCEVKLAQEADS